MTKRRAPFFLSLLLAAVSAGADDAQPLTTKELTGTGDGQDAYYSFAAGPGMVIVRTEAMVQPGSADASLTAEICRADTPVCAEPLATARIEESGSEVEQAVRKALTELLSEIATPKPVLKRKAVRTRLEEAQTLILRIHAGLGVATYSVKLDGAIELAGGDEGEQTGVSALHRNQEEQQTGVSVTSEEEQTGVSALQEDEAVVADEAEPPAEEVVDAPPPADPQKGKTGKLKIPGKKKQEPVTKKVEPEKKTPVFQTVPKKPVLQKIPKKLVIKKLVESLQ